MGHLIALDFRKTGAFLQSGNWMKRGILLNCIHPILLDDELYTALVSHLKSEPAQCQTLQYICPHPHPQLPQFHSCESTGIVLKSW